MQERVEAGDYDDIKDKLLYDFAMKPNNETLFYKNYMSSYSWKVLYDLI